VENWGLFNRGGATSIGAPLDQVTGNKYGGPILPPPLPRRPRQQLAWIPQNAGFVGRVATDRAAALSTRSRTRPCPRTVEGALIRRDGSTNQAMNKAGQIPPNHQRHAVLLGFSLRANPQTRGFQAWGPPPWTSLPRVASRTSRVPSLRSSRSYGYLTFRRRGAPAKPSGLV
jgi:hypothetical protein